MALDDFLKTVSKAFEKSFKDRDSKIGLLSEAKEVTGLIVDNPLFEFLLDRRFIAYGRPYLVYGNRGNSKTSLFYDLAKQVQTQNGYVFWFETEHAYDKNYALKQGVDISRVIVDHPKTLEEAYTKILITIQNLDKLDPEGNTPVLICLDSIAGCMTEYENDDKLKIADMKVGAQATATTRFYRRLVDMLSTEKCIFLALNQEKEKIGGMPIPGADNTSLPGGRAQFFHSTYHWKMAKLKEFYAKDAYGAERKVGSRHSITGKRNKLGREGNKQQIEFDLYIDGGVDWWSPLVRKLSSDYPFMIGHTRGYTWKLEGYEYKVGDQVGTIPTDKALSEEELGQLIRHSTQAKEKIREVFGIPPLPKEEEVVAAETERKTRRRTKKKIDIESEFLAELNTPPTEDEEKEI